MTTTGLEGSLVLNILSTGEYPEIICDTVPSINDNVNSRITRTPIVTFKADQAFAFDAGSTAYLSFSITRNNPVNPDDNSTDSREWSNARFESALSSYIDRWQAETDGCQLIFTPFTTGQRRIEENVYLSSLTIKVDKGVAETLYITLDVDVGTMTAKTKPIVRPSTVVGYGDSVNWDQAVITMTSSKISDDDTISNYVLFLGVENAWNCVKSYSIICGPEQPFPILTMEISKKNLSAVAPDLVDDIVAGRNKVFVHGVGAGEYIVTRVSSSGQNYKVTAYSVYEQYRGSPIDPSNPNDTVNGGISFGTDGLYKTPYEVIIQILTDASSYGQGGNRIYFDLKDIIHCYRTDNNNNKWLTSNGRFGPKSDAWYVLNVCAARLGCKIWFADNKAYLIDTSIDDINSSDVSKSDNFEFLELESLSLNRDEYFPENMSQSEVEFTQSVCGDTELGDEGSDVLRNYNVVAYGSSNAKVVAITSNSNASVAKFGRKSSEIAIPEIGYDDAVKISERLNDRYCDSEQSIAFNLSEIHYSNEETHTGKYWQQYFSQATRVGKIYDYSKDLVISNKANFPSSQGKTLTFKNKLTMSTAEFFFPQGYTQYWFGIMSQTDFTQGTSEINSMVYNG